MASAVRKMLGGGDTALQSEVDKYRLLVTAGGTYDQRDHQVVPVNADTPVIIDNEFMTAKIVVRIRNFRGLPSQSPESSSYFDDPIHERDQYSLGFSFVPKKDLPSVDTVWGNDFDHPIRARLPPPFLINTAFRIVKEFIDPGLEIDAYADEPWVYGPSLSCWFGLRIGDKVAEGENFPAPSDTNVLKEGADGSGQEVRASLNLPENNEKRRKHFLDARNRQAFTFEKGRLYQGDFYNPYIDFGNFLLKLPGFSLKVIKYVEEKTHCLRYVFKNRETGDVYFDVNFHLLWGEQLQRAIEADELDRKEGKSGPDTRLKWVVCPPEQTDVARTSVEKPSARQSMEKNAAPTPVPAPAPAQAPVPDHDVVPGAARPSAKEVAAEAPTHDDLD